VKSTGTRYQQNITAAKDTTLTRFGPLIAVQWAAYPNRPLDGLITKKGATYYLWFKNDSTKFIEYATAASLYGPYTIVQSGDWAGWGATNKEGPALAQMPDGRWRMYMDEYNALGMYYSDCVSDSWDVWTTPTRIYSRDAANQVRPVLRHCTPIVVSR